MLVLFSLGFQNTSQTIAVIICSPPCCFWLENSVEKAEIVVSPSPHNPLNTKTISFRTLPNHHKTILNNCKSKSRESVLFVMGKEKSPTKCCTTSRNRGQWLSQGWTSNMRPTPLDFYEPNCTARVLVHVRVDHVRLPTIDRHSLSNQFGGYLTKSRKSI